MKNTTKPKHVVVKATDVKRRPGDLERLRAASNRPVDTSDVSAVTPDDVASGRIRIVRRSAPPHRKVSLTLRLDEDIVAWFKAQGEGYQTRMNEALREYRATLADGGVDAVGLIEQIEGLLTQMKRKVS